MTDSGRTLGGGVVAATSATIRPARPEESAAIAELFLISSDGLAEYIWGRTDMPGLSPIEIGAQRYAREDVDFSYRQCLMAVSNGEVAGMVHSFEMPPGDGVEEDPVLRPYAELEDAGSLYISGIAVHPGFRDKGIGTRLLEAAHDRARQLALPRVSLICFEQNEAAMRLYRRHAYVEQDRRALVPHPSLHYTDGDAILLVKPV